MDVEGHGTNELLIEETCEIEKEKPVEITFLDPSDGTCVARGATGFEGGGNWCTCIVSLHGN